MGKRGPNANARTVVYYRRVRPEVVPLLDKVVEAGFDPSHHDLVVLKDDEKSSQIAALLDDVERLTAEVEDLKKGGSVDRLGDVTLRARFEKLQREYEIQVDDNLKLRERLKGWEGYQ